MDLLAFAFRNRSGPVRGVTALRIALNLAGAEGFEPPSQVLETRSLTVELTPLKASVQ